MRVLLDTNVVSEAIRPLPDAAVARWLTLQPGTDLFLSAVTEAELRLGVALLPDGRRREALGRLVDDILRVEFAGRILPFDSRAAVAFAALSAERKRAGRPISVADAQIAATALVCEAALATRNVADFQNCGVEVIDPWATPTGHQA